MSEIQNPSIRPAKPAMLDIATVKPASEKPSDAAFSAVLKEQIDVTMSAEGGKPLPEGGQVRLESRQLLGGTRIKVSGEEPSAKGLEEFARSQGIDPQALGLLKEFEASSEPMSALAAEKQSASHDGSAEVFKGPGVKGLDIDRAMTRVASRIGGSSSLVTAALEAHALLDSSRSVGPQLQIQSAALYEHVDDLKVSDVEDILLDDQAAMAVDPTTGGKLRASDKLALSPDELEDLSVFNGLAPTETTRTADSPQEQGANVASRIINHSASVSLHGANQGTHQSQPFSGAALGLDAVFGKDMPQPAMSDVKINSIDMTHSAGSYRAKSDVALETFLRDPTARQPETKGRNSSVVTGEITAEIISKAQARLQREHLAGKISLPKVDISSLKLGGEQVATAKLPAINLTSVMPDQGPIGLQSNGLSPVSSLVAGGAGFAFESGSSGQPGGHSAAPENLQEDAAEQLLRRQDQQNQLSQRLSQVLGQRLSAQIERGSWRVEMDLHPASMGRIEVQLEMRNGELEANFLSSNAATRELLNESLHRLREMLEQFGTNSAYVGLGAGNKGQHDGNSAPGAEMSSLDAGDSNGPADSDSDRKPVSDDGLDVMV
jgi:flagellar hook-length control protein FliK